LRGYVLEVTPAEAPKVRPFTGCPSAQGRDLLELPLHSPTSVRRSGIDRHHDAVHQAPHRGEATTVHKPAMDGRAAPCRGKDRSDRVPVGQQQEAYSLDVGVSGREIPIREQAAGGGCEAAPEDAD